MRGGLGGHYAHTLRPSPFLWFTLAKAPKLGQRCVAPPVAVLTVESVNKFLINISTERSNSELAHTFEKDEWEAWREHPLTAWFMDEFLAGKAIEAKQTFIDYAWGKREIDPIFHATLYERAQVLEQMRNLTFDDTLEAT